ncbi:BMP family ABC transporter substrate-binding protein [Alicyclobacillus fastidiosus]|uniref:BMP family ABC transporter substrate-binding protein n=1 Tax=Alicyclobacillus fastidiosus TaxID=392011 RepID=A0ABY6ZFQ8_9BACL|nr:BMP family ABC transporter substrate-binding protein [Alicyclobacillus fastidiosus]WAH41683.1 BMP family ABC transporter substrate-binding protein [Alicyclobacillus fastidiosus]GMA63362.1 BMP family ABC transporter substrate-binding protein [Alicyclobacillus fastidiosus]
MRKKLLSAAAAAVALTVLTAGCGTNSTGGSTSAGNAAGSASGSTSSLKVGLVTDTGGLNDNSFNHLAYVGLQKAEQQLGVKGSVVQSQSESDYVPNLSKYAQQGYGLVIAVGYLMHDAVEQVAKEYPKTDFLIIDDSITDRPNVSSAIFKSEEAGYLAGAMAGLLQTGHSLKGLNSQNVVGVIGGQDIPPVDSYIAGFQQGFKKEDPTGKVLLQYTNSFTDQALGSQYAQNQMSQGADIIFPVAGGCGIGAINAVKSAGKYAIGVDTDQAYLAPQNVITSAMKGVDTSVFDTVKSVQSNTFHSGVTNFDLKGNGVGLGKVLSGVPQSVIDKVNALKQEIESGKIQVSANVQ